MDIKGHAAIVTGGGSGLGAETAADSNCRRVRSVYAKSRDWARFTDTV